MITEQFVEEFVLTLFSNLGYDVQNGAQISPDSSNLYRKRYEEVYLDFILIDSIKRLNPQVPLEALEDALRKVHRPISP